MPKSNHTSSKNDHTVHLIPGLSNPNASCYLNSSLQLLASSSVLHATLPLPGADSGTASPSSPSLQSLLSGDSYTDLPLTSALTAILNKLWNGTSKGPQSAAGLQRLLAAKNGDLDGSSQQDAHEALLNLLDQIRLEEVDMIKKIQPPKPSIKRVKRRRRVRTAAGSASETETEDESTSSSDEEVIDQPVVEKPTLEPFIDSLFGGRLASFIVCDACHHVSLSSEPFLDLSLAMHSEVKPRKRDRLRSLLTKSSPPLIESSASDSSPTHLSPRTAGTSDTSEPEEESRTGRLASPKEDAKVGRRRSLNLDSSKRSIWGSSQRNAKSREASPDRSGLTSLRRSATTKAKISTEQAQYIKSVLAEVPSPTGLSPLDLLRVAQPLHLRQGPNTPISPDAKPSSADERLTGLYAALQRFTAVEVLEKDNAFQCRKCWRAEHPEFARPKRRPKTFQHAHSPLATPNTQERDDDTPSGTNVEPSRVALKDATSSLQQLQMVDRRVESSATDPVKSPSIHSKELLPSITIDSSAESNGSIGLSPTVSTTHTSYYASSDVESPGNSDAEDSAAIKSNPRLKRPPKAERFIARRAHKRFLISHLPPMLIIHFNRFQQTKNSIFTSSIFSNLKKIDDFVSFPLILNMAPFLAPLGKPPKETDEKKEHGSLLPRFWASHKLLHQDERLKHSKYRLSAIVVHTGTMGSGHYITFVQATKTKPVKRVELEPDQLNSKSSSGDLAEESTTSLSAVDEMQATKVKEQEKEEVKEVASNWLYCSDEEVRPANITEVLNCKAYLLLYEQI